MTRAAGAELCGLQHQKECSCTHRPPLEVRVCAQAAVAAAVGTILRKHGPAPGPDLATGPHSSQGRLADRVFALCRWRDRLARRQDESAPSASYSPFPLLKWHHVALKSQICITTAYTFIITVDITGVFCCVYMNINIVCK